MKTEHQWPQRLPPFSIGVVKECFDLCEDMAQYVCTPLPPDAHESIVEWRNELLAQYNALEDKLSKEEE